MDKNPIKGVRDAWTWLSNPDPYVNESDEDYQSRMNLLQEYARQISQSGYTLDELAAIEAGIELRGKK